MTNRPAPTRAPVESPPFDLPPTASYFHAVSGEDVYRIYVTEWDLLVFKLGPGTVSHGQFTPRTKMRILPGGGLIMAVAVWRESERLRLAARVRDLLEAADEETLREYAAARDGGYVVHPDDVEEMRIDPPSFWDRLFGGEQEGVLRFRHHYEGRKALALPTTKDVRQAAEAAMRLFGDVVRINVPWAAAAVRTAQT